jgi:hypothetical protein
MRYFLKFILKYLIILLVINFFFIYVKSIYLNGYIIGGSRKNVLIDKTLIQNTVLLADSYGNALQDLSDYNVSNFSSPSDNYIDMENKLKYILLNTKIDTLFIGVNNHTLSPYRELTNNVPITKTLIDNKAKIILKYFPLFNNYMVNLTKSHIWSIISKYFINSSVQNNFSDKKLWCELNSIEKKEMATARYSFQFSSRFRSEVLVQSLERIINLCKKNDVLLFGIKFPLTKEFNSISNINYGADSLIINNEYDVFDFTNVITDSCMFYNQDHLNILGAEEFVKILFINY